MPRNDRTPALLLRNRGWVWRQCSTMQNSSIWDPLLYIVILYNRKNMAWWFFSIPDTMYVCVPWCDTSYGRKEGSDIESCSVCAVSSFWLTELCKSCWPVWTEGDKESHPKKISVLVIPNFSRTFFLIILEGKKYGGRALWANFRGYPQI